MTNAERTQKISNAVAFERANVSANGGYATRELAGEAIRLNLIANYNLVSLGSEEIDGFYFPQYNVFD